MMKLKCIWVLFFSLFVATTMAQSDYATQWQQVEKFRKDNLPKSALNVVEVILKKSLTERNTQQAIKAMIYRNNFKTEIDYTVSSDLITDFYSLLSDKSTAVEKSLIHSLIAELYNDYYTDNRWRIDQRPFIMNKVPEDMAEWSKNIFREKIQKELEKSVSDVNPLLQSKPESYGVLIDAGKDSRALYPTMYDFLMRRALTLLSEMNNEEEFSRELRGKAVTLADLANPAKNFVALDLGEAKSSLTIQTLHCYRSFLLSLQQRKLYSSFLSVDLWRMNYIATRSAEFSRRYKLNTLLRLEKENEQNPSVVEVIGEIVNYYTSNTPDPGKQYEWLKKAISLYPNHEYINTLKNKLIALENPSATLSGKKAFSLTEKKTVTLQYKNLNRATVYLYKYEEGKDAVKVKEFPLELNPKNTYAEEKQDIYFQLDAVGNYYMELSFDKKQEKVNKNDRKFNFSVTNLISLSKQIDKTHYSVYVTDRETGKPLSKVSVSAYSGGRSKKDFLQTYWTDENGQVQFSINKKDAYSSYYYKLSKDKDSPDIFTPLNQYYYYYPDEAISNEKAETSVVNLTLLTDRSIYRPGQTVYFKLIATEGRNGTNRVLENKSYEVKLLDANGQEVSKKNLQTNDFGSLAGEFVLPQGLLNGQFSVAVGDNFTYFSVEEYKRPTFLLSFDKVEKTYKFGEAITLKGRAENYSGVKLQDVDVNYTVTRQRLRLWRWNSAFNQQAQVEEQVVKTGDDGSFTVSFVPQKEETDHENGYFPSAYLFTVKATITDLNGETQSEEYYVRVADISMILNVNLDGKYSKEDGKPISVRATNLDENEISTKGTYVVYALDEKDSIASQVLKGDFVSGIQTGMEQKIKKLSSGKYRILLKASDSNGKEVEEKSDFILYSIADKHPPYGTNNWLIEKNTEIAPGKQAEVILGVSDKDVYVLYELMKGNNVLEQKVVKLSGENRLFLLPYKKEYEQNTKMIFTLIRQGKMIQHRIDITGVTELKQLKLKFEAFRDKLRPGQKEEWRITVKDTKDQASVSELLASMYDQSLDKIHPVNEWRLALMQKFSEHFTSLYRPDNSFDGNNSHMNFISQYLQEKELDLDRFNWFNANRAFGVPVFSQRNYKSKRLGNRAMAMPNVVSESAAEDSESVAEDIVMLSKTVSSNSIAKTSLGSASPVQLRANFNETAFFYPQLRTDEKGGAVISFTVPESNTTWRFRALAYDKELNSGQLEATVVTHKELMVTPNLPRFVRVGDRTSVSAKISNLSSGVVLGKVRLEFFNPFTEEILNVGVENAIQSVDLKKDASSVATWTFVVPNNYDVLGCRMIAETESFSDGEQHVIAVLPDKMLVTETLPIFMRGKQSKQFSFDRLLNNQSASLNSQRLTLEFSSNPAWYAIQALPVLSNPDGDNAVNWFASYYVNTLGSFIPKQYPRVASVIEAWKQQGGTKETLLSSLQKNEELKNVLLQETPWVLEAKNETEQKQSLSLLFDMNRSQMLTSAAIRKLADLQTEEGGWSWFKGLYSSRSITQYILYGFSQLTSLNAVEYPEEVKLMQVKALGYLDAEIATDFARLKKLNKSWRNISSIPTSDLEYVYVRSLYRDVPPTKEALAAEKFYTSVLTKYWTKLSLYEQSLLAVLLKNNGDRSLSGKIIASLREHATVSPAMGMYWANNRSNVFFANSAIGTHTFLMDAFKVCSPVVEELDNMKLWLLRQKQTQQWESTHGTLSAIYALLSNGSDWLENKGNVGIRLGNTDIDTSDKELGTGYLKQSWEKTAISRDLGNISIDKKDNGSAYGAVYWQYFEDLNKIESHRNAELNVSKRLFREIASEKGKELQEITAGEKLHVGDKVVIRLLVRADRDMEFVHLKDLRASCFEPVDQTSGIQWNAETICYRTSRDASTNFYFDHLPKGTHTFDYEVYVSRSGEYKNGIASIQCMYAPEFTSHTEGMEVKVK